jgi:hypothetical protein
MKKLLGIGVLAVLVGVVYQSNAKESIGVNDYYVVLKVPATGNTIALSDKYNGYDQCTNSDEYIVNNALSKQAGTTIRCVNELPTYK